VAGSDPATEVAEAEVKFQPMLRALGAVPDQSAGQPGSSCS
jgi:hypothetical protein